MKIKLIILASLLVVISAYTCVAQIGGPPKPNGPIDGKDLPNKLPPTAAKLPDLIIQITTGGNLDNGEVSVRVKNQGKSISGRSDVELSISYGSQPPVSFVHAVPPMPPGKTEVVTFDLKQSIVQAPFCATVDSLKTVTESNENNNKRCGKFGGKP